MGSLRKKALKGLAQFVAVLAVLLFLPAWSLRYWQAWVFWVVFSSAITAITLYFLKRDPALIERRLKAGPVAEKQTRQKIIQSLANLFFLVLIVFPAVDHRRGWSHVSAWLAITGDALVLLGLYIVFLVFKENSYTSGIIEVGEGQRVISTGPYGVVRHPMYAGALVLLVGIPLALGSVWGLWLCVPVAAVIVWRLLEEEKYLVVNLPGYGEYLAKTRYRLIPGIF